MLVNCFKKRQSEFKLKILKEPCTLALAMKTLNEEYAETDKNQIYFPFMIGCTQVIDSQIAVELNGVII